MALEELVSMGVSNIITFDAHDPRVQNAIPLSGLDNFMPTYQFVKALFKHDNTLKIDKDHLMVISPDEGAMSRAVYLANNLGVDMGMFYKRRDYSKVINGRNPIVAHEFLGSSVGGKTVIVVDDMIASGESMLDTAKELKERKAEKVVVCCTFGLFTAGFEKFDEFYQKGYIDSVVTTNLNYRSPELFTKEWYVEADMSKYIAAIINSLNHDVSIGNSLSPTDKTPETYQKVQRGSSLILNLREYLTPPGFPIMDSRRRFFRFYTFQVQNPIKKNRKFQHFCRNSRFYFLQHLSFRSHVSLY